MTAEMYFHVGAIIAVIGYIPTVMVMLMSLLSVVVRFVDDDTSTGVPKYVGVFSELSLTSAWFKVVGDDLAPSDWQDVTFGIFLDILIAMGLVILWPVAIVGGFAIGIMLLMRKIVRLGKRVSKIGKVAHTHPDSVEYTKEEI